MHVVCIYLGVVFFFFQAEDGIRDLVRSRGLGDVYKRQPAYLYHDEEMHDVVIVGEIVAIAAIIMSTLSVVVDLGRPDPVSYTHLTLPTSDLV